MTITTAGPLCPGMDTYRLDDYETWLRSWGAAESTLLGRLVIARAAALQWPDPGQVGARDLSQFLADPAFSAWTRCTYYGHLRSLFSWLHADGIIDADPSEGVRRPQTPKNKPRPMTALEAQRALHSCDGAMHTWLLLGLFAGLRAHETAKMRGEDITELEIFVRGKGGKDAMIPTHPILWQAAQAYPREGWWFPAYRECATPHVWPSTISANVTRHFREQRIMGSYHRCRHTYGTGLLRAGVNLRVVQELMRHESLATTAIYTQVPSGAVRDAVLAAVG